MKTTFLAVIISFTITSVALAAPTITSTNGTVASGQAITIDGSNFGTGPSSVLLWDDFDGGTNGKILNASPNLGSWKVQQGGSISHIPPVYSTTQAYSGTQSSYGYQGTAGYDLWSQFAVSLKDSPYFYSSFWVRYDVHGATLGQAKYVQLWGNSRGTTPGTTCNDYNPGVFAGGGSSTYIALETGTCFASRQYQDPIPQGKWVQIEMYGKQSTPGLADGSVRVHYLMSGANDYVMNNVVTRTIAGDYWNESYFFKGLSNFSGGTGVKEVWVDDAYANNTWARVVISDNSNYNSATTLIPQIPQAWTDGQIQVKVNQGKFASNSTAYLFVIDANGNVSAGKPITFGSAVTGGTAIIAPNNLRVVAK